MLTGDKVETAVNIALSCRLFDSSMSIVELRERDLEEASSPEQQALVRGGGKGVYVWALLPP